MSPDVPSYLDCALITGASSGLGREFANQLAPVTQHLILVARRQDRLAKARDEIISEHPSIKITPIVSDLSIEEERESLISYLKEHRISPTLLINNAGLGDYGEFTSSKWEKIHSMMEVNMAALTHLSYSLLPEMKARGNGAILNISSLASILPIADFAVYAATKAYVTSFGEALRAELQEDNIPVLTVCPGPIHTEFGEVAARDGREFEAQGYEYLYVTSKKVVTEALNALFQNKARLYPGWKVAAFAAVVTALPICAIRLFNSNRSRRIED